MLQNRHTKGCGCKVHGFYKTISLRFSAPNSALSAVGKKNKIQARRRNIKI
jgi:hypothetical protein